MIDWLHLYLWKMFNCHGTVRFAKDSRWLKAEDDLGREEDDCKFYCEL